MYGKRKGQFFILGALLLCAVFFAAMPAHMAVTGGYAVDIPRVAGNLEGEIPHALNLAMLDDGSPGKLGDFTGFIRDEMNGRYLGMESLWVVAVPDQDSPGDVRIYAGNWLGRPVTVHLIVDSAAESIVLDDSETDSKIFHGVGSDFTLSISFENRTWSGQVARDKTGLYNYMRLSRGDDSVVNEIIG